MFEHGLEIDGFVVGRQRRERRSGPPGVSTQGEDLGEGAVIGHEGAGEECLSRLTPSREGHGPALAQGSLRGATQSLGIGHGHKAQGEGARLVTQLSAMVVTDEALVHPAELLGPFPELGERDGTCVHPDGLRGHAVHEEA